MPVTPLPEQHLEGMEALEDDLAALHGVIAECIDDGTVTVRERRRIHDSLAAVLDRFRAQHLTAMEIASGARLIRAIANTFRMTPKVERLAHEADVDLGRLLAEHARRRIRKFTATGTYLELMEGGGGDDQLPA